MKQHNFADGHGNRRRRVLGFLAAILSIGLVALVAIVVAHRRADSTGGSLQSQADVATTNPDHPESPVSAANAPNPSPAERLSVEFSDLADSIPAVVGLAAVAVGGDGSVLSLGQWDTGPAWSTSKVPLVLAKMQQDSNRNITPQMTKAITQSDNDSAKKIWASMGTPQEAASKMEEVLRAFGDPTDVEYRELRAAEGYSAFGQTNWSLANQASFMSRIACDQQAVPLLDLMGQVEKDQRWGLGTIPDARFKGGWGPSTSGQYLVRQVGLVPTPKGTVAVAIAAQPNAGEGPGGLENGERALDTLVGWINSHLEDFPAGSCA